MEWRQAFRYGLVGLSGIIVNMGVLYYLTERVGLYYLLSSLVAIELSILSNFILNDLWTFRERREIASPNRVKRAFAFHLVSAGGLVINWSILFSLTEYAGFYYLHSNLIGILAGFIWNYLVNRHYTWSKR
ncbi:MAG: GtrA family protein [Methanomicrobiales archaeon]|nr:GtrA family protein [Methanomicrobiales archaeon]